MASRKENLSLKYQLVSWFEYANYLLGDLLMWLAIEGMYASKQQHQSLLSLLPALWLICCKGLFVAAYQRPLHT
ncbi:MAG: hypothetical protein HC815_21990 [Richelia sp. RM1_1_1]|nr:hypothetical protein [Richelia sp. SM1_7_0]NJN10509.1 hypothetical protein [Richelia sp. RM1_1_1]